jgi:hypothetical protein
MELNGQLKVPTALFHDIALSVCNLANLGGSKSRPELSGEEKLLQPAKIRLPRDLEVTLT